MSTSQAEFYTVPTLPPEAIADAALVFLSDHEKAGAYPPGSREDFQPSRSSAAPSIEVTAPFETDGDASNVLVPLLPTATADATPREVPSLLRFVDNTLMQSAPIHNRPRHAHDICSICFRQGVEQKIVSDNGRGSSMNVPAVTSTFLPLWPCGHWVHYRCLIWRATRTNAEKDKCPVCNIQLYQWEGITALTLATRTRIDMEDIVKVKSADLTPLAHSDEVEFATECATIDSLIHANFFAELANPSQFTDDSPNLIQVFYNVIDALERMEKPAARWLRYFTPLGRLLYGMFVAIKLQRYLVASHAKIQGTEGWVEFEEGAKTLQGKILDEVRKA
ncbi:hypothetical protein CC86DRAFT_421972 [Ophiobolus disseminans]|uniref:RING-type domain-containing protein n=1 Tax=Ophiobolus disseminans TaxID=1469910 RepID=A0A6A6ZSD4_9PLEO|nr:hypothetical protein CC86DRAFT_421972 [Ophiobolus disseminans]